MTVIDNWMQQSGRYRRAAKSAKKLFSVLYYTDGVRVVWACVAKDAIQCKFVRGPSICTKPSQEYIQKYKPFVYGKHHWHKEKYDLVTHFDAKFGIKFHAGAPPMITDQLREFAV